MSKVDLKNFSLPELEQFLSGQGKERFRATQIFKWLYQQDAHSFAEMTNLSKELRHELEETAFVSNLTPETVEVGDDGTRKYLFTLADGEAVESVLIPDEGRNTLCISSQVGCAMACEFCLTGTFSPPPWNGASPASIGAPWTPAWSATAPISQAAEKGPSAALARSGTRCGVPGVRLTRPFARRLASGPF